MLCFNSALRQSRTFAYVLLHNLFVPCDPLIRSCRAKYVFVWDNHAEVTISSVLFPRFWNKSYHTIQNVLWRWCHFLRVINWIHIGRQWGVQSVKRVWPSAKSSYWISPGLTANQARAKAKQSQLNPLTSGSPSSPALVSCKWKLASSSSSLGGGPRTPFHTQAVTFELLDLAQFCAGNHSCYEFLCENYVVSRSHHL